MRILCLQHSLLHGEIHLPHWARKRGHEWESVIVPDLPSLPSADELDCLMVMGGPMSAWEDADHPWMESEKRLIEDMIGAGKPLLGVGSLCC